MEYIYIYISKDPEDLRMGCHAPWFEDFTVREYIYIS